MPDLLFKFHYCDRFHVDWDAYEDLPQDRIHLTAYLASRENAAKQMLAEEQNRNPGATYIRMDDEDDPPV